MPAELLVGVELAESPRRATTRHRTSRRHVVGAGLAAADERPPLLVVFTDGSDTVGAALVSRQPPTDKLTT